MRERKVPVSRPPRVRSDVGNINWLPEERGSPARAGARPDLRSVDRIEIRLRQARSCPMRETLSVSTEQQHGRKYLAVGPFFDSQQVLVENAFEGVSSFELGDHIGLAKRQQLRQSRCERQFSSPTEEGSVPVRRNQPVVCSLKSGETPKLRGKVLRRTNSSFSID